MSDWRHEERTVETFAQAEWASQDDADRYYEDLMLHGRAYSKLEGGKRHHVALLGVFRVPRDGA